MGLGGDEDKLENGGSGGGGGFFESFKVRPSSGEAPLHPPLHMHECERTAASGGTFRAHSLPSPVSWLGFWVFTHETKASKQSKV